MVGLFPASNRTSLILLHHFPACHPQISGAIALTAATNHHEICNKLNPVKKLGDLPVLPNTPGFRVTICGGSD